MCCIGKCSFKDLTVSFCERFKGFLSNTKGLHRRAKLSQNTASAYFNAFMSIVNLAHQDGIIKTDINTKILAYIGNTTPQKSISTKRRFADSKEWSLRNIPISNERAYHLSTRDCGEATSLRSIGRVYTSTRRKGRTLTLSYIRHKQA